MLSSVEPIATPEALLEEDLGQLLGHPRQAVRLGRRAGAGSRLPRRGDKLPLDPRQEPSMWKSRQAEILPPAGDRLEVDPSAHDVSKTSANASSVRAALRQWTP